jgi:large subunit ribosomal protein L20
MTRVKKAVNALKGRRNILRQAKGFRFARSKKEKAASEALMHAGAYAFAHRRDKKGSFRRSWNISINAGLGEELTYSKFMGALKKQGILINRKMLASLATENQETFKRIVTKTNK